MYISNFNLLVFLLFGRIYRYVRKNICMDNPDVVEINQLKTLIQNADVELAKLQKIRDELKVRLEQFQTELQLEVEDYEDEAVKVADNDEYVD